MKLIYMAFGISIGVWIALAIYVFSEIKKTYGKKGTFTGRLLSV